MCGRMRYGQRSQRWHESLAGQFAVKTGQADGKGLQCTHGVVVVQREDVLSNTAELHHDVVRWRTDAGRGKERNTSKEQRLQSWRR